MLFKLFLIINIMFFVKEDNVRGGNRGGRSQFNWDDIRLLNNKDRESYLGVTQSIGFLDKGGKWRKRDWYLKDSHKVEKNLDRDKINFEKETLRREEEKLLMQSLGGDYKKHTKSNNKLTDYEWKELMKKEANFNPDEAKMFEFYENDEHKAGLGVKTAISYKTNPYEKGIVNNLTKLEGNVKEDEEKNPYAEASKGIIDTTHNSTRNHVMKGYIKDYIKEKRKNKEEIRQEEKTNRQVEKSKEKKKSKRSRSRSRSRNKDKKSKKDHRK
jgi:hypothetical protein